jgi:hypothetical protein
MAGVSLHFAIMRNRQIGKVVPLDVKALKAVASPVRAAILAYLKRPADHFPPQEDATSPPTVSVPITSARS